MKASTQPRGEPGISLRMESTVHVQTLLKIGAICCQSPTVLREAAAAGQEAEAEAGKTALDLASNRRPTAQPVCLRGRARLPCRPAAHSARYVGIKGAAFAEISSSQIELSANPGEAHPPATLTEPIYAGHGNCWQSLQGPPCLETTTIREENPRCSGWNSDPLSFPGTAGVSIKMLRGMKG